MIEVFMLVVLILTFVDILLQTYIHYILKEKPTKKVGEDEEDEEEVEEGERETLFDIIRQQLGKAKHNNKTEDLNRQNQLTIDQIFDLAMGSEEPSSMVRQENTDVK
jgi:hypothetical protein